MYITLRDTNIGEDKTMLNVVDDITIKMEKQKFKGTEQEWKNDERTIGKTNVMIFVRFLSLPQNKL